MSTEGVSLSTHKHQSELIDEFDMLLGRSIRCFQLLDMIIEFRLLELTASSSRPSGDLVELLQTSLAEVSFSTKSRLFASLLAHQLPARAEFKVCKDSASLAREMERSIAALKRLGKLEEFRNRYVHSHWFAIGQPPESTELIPVVRIKTRATPKKIPHDYEEFPSEKFREFITEVEEVQKELGEATGRLLGLLDYDEDRKDRTTEKKT